MKKNTFAIAFILFLFGLALAGDYTDEIEKNSNDTDHSSFQYLQCYICELFFNADKVFVSYKTKLNNGVEIKKIDSKKNNTFFLSNNSPYTRWFHIECCLLKINNCERSKTKYFFRKSNLIIIYLLSEYYELLKIKTPKNIQIKRLNELKNYLNSKKIVLNKGEKLSDCSLKLYEFLYLKNYKIIQSKKTITKLNLAFEELKKKLYGVIIELLKSRKLIDDYVNGDGYVHGCGCDIVF